MEAEEILQLDLKNLEKKVKAGQPLSASERAVLQSTVGGGKPSDQRFAKNQVELAEILGVDRKTVQRHLKIEGNPGARPDGRYEITAWRKWSDERKGISDGELSAPLLKAKQILLQNQKLEAHLKIIAKEYVPLSDLEEWVAELASAVRKIITQIHLAAPSVVGVSVPEAEERLKETEAEVMDQFHTIGARIEEWKGKGEL